MRALGGTLEAAWADWEQIRLAELQFAQLPLAQRVTALNAFVRDIQEFTTVAFLLWFYATPVIYPMVESPSNPIPGWVLDLVRLNPLSQFVAVFRAGLYDFTAPGLATTAAATVSATLMFVVGWTVFARLSPRFAKEV